MKEKYRQLFNSQFTDKKYQEFKDDIASDFDYAPTFRIGETPFFISNELKAQILEGCDDVIKLIQQKNFKKLTEKSLYFWEYPLNKHKNRKYINPFFIQHSTFIIQHSSLHFPFFPVHFFSVQNP